MLWFVALGVYLCLCACVFKETLRCELRSHGSCVPTRSYYWHELKMHSGHLRVTQDLTASQPWHSPPQPSPLWAKNKEAPHQKSRDGRKVIWSKNRTDACLILLKKNKKTGVEKLDCIKVTALYRGREEQGGSALELCCFQECQGFQMQATPNQSTLHSPQIKKTLKPLWM